LLSCPDQYNIGKEVLFSLISITYIFYNARKVHGVG